MKKNLFMALAIVAITTVSCRKDHTCTCNTTTTVSTTTGNTTISETSTGSDETTFIKSKKKSLKRDAGCVDRTESSTNISGNQNQTVRVTTVDYSCDLK